MAITTMAGLRSASPGQEGQFAKNGATAASGGFHSTFFLSTTPVAGASIGNATTGVIPTNATQGAVPFVNPASGNSYLLRMQASSQQLGTVVLADRVWHGGPYTSVNGSISANTTTAVDRDTTGYGVELWCEIASGLSAVTTTLTATYVNQDGTTGRTATCVVPASAVLGRMLPFTLQAGDVGMRQITALNGTAAPTGTFNLVMLRKIAQVACSSINKPFAISWEDTGLQRIYDNACLFIFKFCGAGNSGFIGGTFNIVQG